MLSVPLGWGETRILPELTIERNARAWCFAAVRHSSRILQSSTQGVEKPTAAGRHLLFGAGFLARLAFRRLSRADRRLPLHGALGRSSRSLPLAPRIDRFAQARP